MNKIQMIKLLNLRGITELKGDSIASAIKKSGGEPTDKEMVEVNQQAMEYYISALNDKDQEIILLSEMVKHLEHKVQKYENILDNQKPVENIPLDTSQDYVARLEERSQKLSALEAAGVDNWDGYDFAMGLLKDNLEN